MNEELRTKYFELKQKQDQLYQSRTSLEQTVKDLRSNALTVGHHRAQLDDLQRQNGKANQNELLKIQEKLKSAELVNQELFDQRTHLTTEIDELSTAELEYDQHLSRIASELDSPEIEGLIPGLERTLTQRNAAMKALQLGKAIDRTLDEVTEQLWETREAGFFDLLGVPIIGDYLKYKKFKAAKKQITELQKPLNDYIAELQTNSFELTLPDKPNLSGSTQFFDYFFDGIVMDGAVLSKVQKSLDAYNRLQKRVQRIQEQLESVIVNLNAELEQQQELVIKATQLEIK